MMGLSQESREVARQNGVDIRELRESVAFERYWLRRVRMKRDAAFKSFMHDPPEKCRYERREELRQLVLAYDELLGMLDADEPMARKMAG